jgi:4-amino-4-deoxy-L-arabinose transferase-like glycosyltransferase
MLIRISSNNWFRTAAISLPLILVAALGLRLAFAWDYQAQTPHRALSALPFLFESGNIAWSLASGHGFGSPFRVDTGPTAWMTPLYPMLLAGIMRIFGIYTYQSWVAAVLMNIGFSTLACIPVYYAGKQIGGRGLAAGSAWLWAIFPNAILLSFQSLWDASLSALLGATLVCATLWIPSKSRGRDWTLYGLLWGVALMANAAVLSLLPFLLGWAVWHNRNLRHALLACAVAILCCIPWTVRNLRVMHGVVPLRSTLGLQLWVGNNPDAHVVWLGEQHPIHDQAERDRYVQMGELAYMSEKRRNAVRYILTHPAHEAELVGGRFVMFWSGGSPHPIDDFIHNRSAWFRYVLLFNLCAALGALIGIVLLFRKHSLYAIPLAAGPIVFPFAYYLTLAFPRYKLPIDPTLMLLLAIALASGTSLRLRQRSRPVRHISRR